MAAWLDLCRFTPTAGSTTDWTYSSAVTGYNSPALSGVVNGRVYKYRAESSDLSQWEEGEGAYNTGTGVLARTTVFYNSSGTGTATGQSGAGTKINFSAAPQVAVIASKHDLISIEEANSFTSTQSDQARVNILAAGIVRIQTFSASGTYTPNANLLYAIIECWGAGGGGGGTATAAATVGIGGGGGGAGGYSLKISTAAAIGASQTATIGAAGTAGTAGNNAGGAGGDTSIGTICIAKGGSGGGGSAGSGDINPGAGGVAGTGDITATGQSGIQNGPVINAHGWGGMGGSTLMGSGGVGPSSATAQAGAAGTGFGSGGQGGQSYNAGGTAAGGAGTKGYIKITEFCSK
jgi:hypothetical protein